MRILAAAFLFLCTTLGVLGQEYRAGQYPSTTTLFGLTYSPFDFNASRFCLPTAQVQTDMDIIANISDHVRTYSLVVCLENVETILTYCQQNNMRAILGLFLSGDLGSNDAELDGLAGVLATYGDVIDAIAVGNEILFGRHLTVEQLIGYINGAKRIVANSGFSIPVSTAEIWAVLESSVGPTLAAELDFICLNMQPFWEGWEIVCPPGSTGCVSAGNYVHAKAEGLEDYLKKPVWICESGWPTEGERCCQGRDHARDGLLAGPSEANLTIFLEELVNGGKQVNRPTYIHAIFNEDWKREWSPCGTCEGLSTGVNNPSCSTCELDYHFGIYEYDRTPKIGVTLPV